MSGQRLYRSRRDRVLLGVCGGIAHYFRVDPVLVRVLWVLLSLTPFPGLIAYIVAAIVIPEEPAPRQQPSDEQPSGGARAGGTPDAVVPAETAGPGGSSRVEGEELSRQRTVRVIGFGLVALGLFLLIRNWAVVLGIPRLLHHMPWLGWAFWGSLAASWWPLLIMLAGILILVRGLRSNKA